MVPDEQSVIRERVIYAGRVQGVCFRITSVDLSRGRPVVGFVRNLPDGTVELQAEGRFSEVESFLHAIDQHFSGNIRSAERERLSARGDERGFEIRY